MAPCLELRHLDVFEALFMIELSAACFQGLTKGEKHVDVCSVAKVKGNVML